MKAYPRILFALLFLGATVLGVFLADSSFESTAGRPSANAAAAGQHCANAATTPAQRSPAKAAATASTMRAFVRTSSWTLEPEKMIPLKTRLTQVREGTATVPSATLPRLADLRAGERVRFSLDSEGDYEGTVNLVLPSPDGGARLGGELDGGAGGFSFGEHDGVYGGMIQLPARNLTYVLTKTDAVTTRVKRQALSNLECMGLPAPAGQTEVPASILAAIVPTAVPQLDSRPSASQVLLLDFDGEDITDPVWGYGKLIHAKPAIIGTAAMTAAQMTEVFNRVAEEFRPFDIAVTTIASRYANAPVGGRMRCIITPTNYFAENPTWSSSIGGASWLDSFSLTGSYMYSANQDTPCFVFVTTNAADIAQGAAHEFGHALGLVHQGYFYTDLFFGYEAYDTYAPGHGTGTTSWAPLMGLPFGKKVTQWSQGEFEGASTEYYGYSSGHYIPTYQNDILRILRAVNEISLVADTEGSSTLDAPSVGNTGKINSQGIISSETDADYWRIDALAGAITVVATPAVVDPNLDINLQLLASDGVTVLAAGNPVATLNASVAKTVAAGTYYIRVQGSGKGDPVKDGWSAYGSLGQYTLTGVFPQVPGAPQITIQPQPQTVAQGGAASLQVTVLANVPVAYQWQKQNPDLTFSNLAGKTAAVLAFANTQYVSDGVYRVVVTNTKGVPPLASETSQNTRLTVNSKPVIIKQPTALTVAAGSATPATLTVDAIGSPVLLYQWQKETTNVGSDNKSLVIANPQAEDGASYKCIITNAYGNVTSSVVKITVTAAPKFVADPPATKVVPSNGTATITATVIGSLPMTLQWYKDGVKVPGGTKNVLTLAAIKPAAAGTYYLEAKNIYSPTPVLSASCVVTVMVPPLITTHPTAPAPAAEMTAFTLTGAASGDPTLLYQWQKDNVDIPLANSPTYSVTSATWADRGTYRLIVTNPAGSATSKTAIVTIQAKPQITLEPVSNTKIARAGKATLTVAGTGSPTLTYQWQKNTGSGFADIVGAKAASLVLTGVDASAATYQALVKNTFGTATSHVATVTVEDPPKIAVHPLTQTRPLGSLVTFSVTMASGSPVLAYQWQRNGIDLPGETGISLSLPSVVSSAAGAYRVIVKNDVGTVTSNPAILTLLTAPSIVQQPTDLTVGAFAPATFTVVAAGSPTLKYQWFRNSIAISGATAATFTIASAQPANNGTFYVRVTNAADFADSMPVNLTVNPVAPPLLTGMSPSRGRIDALVLISGTNLNWTTGVTMLKTATAYQPCAFKILSATQLLVTVPHIAVTSQFKVTTRAGTYSTPTTFTVTTNDQNDTPDQAMIIPPAGGKVGGDDSSFVRFDFRDPPMDPSGYYEALYSAWHTFTPTVSGVYSVSYDMNYYDELAQDYNRINPRVAVFTGNPLVANLTSGNLVASNRFYNTPRPVDAVQDYAEGLSGLYLNFEDSFGFYAQAGQTYWIVMSGGYYYVGNSTYEYHSGPYGITLIPSKTQ